MKYLVSPAPHKNTRQTLNEMYIVVSLMLVCCLLSGYIFYGMNVLIIIASTLVSCLLFEFIFDMIKTKSAHFPHLSSVVTGLLLACIMPLNMPWFFGIFAAAIAIASKYFFGGLGNNLFNPAALGRLVLGVISVGFSYEYFGGQKTALDLILTGNKGELELAKLFTGEMAGAVGTTCIVVILVAMIVLMILKIIRWENIVFAGISFAGIVWATLGFEYILPMLLSGSFVFATVFMLNDPTSSPYTFSGRCLYSIAYGVIGAFVMLHGILGETAIFVALLICNMVAPMFDAFVSIFHRGVKKND